MPKNILSRFYKMESMEEPLIEEQQISRCTVLAGCLGVTIVAAGILGFVIYIGDMFSKKTWI
jgi:hypothetical protein